MVTLDSWRGVFISAVVLWSSKEKRSMEPRQLRLPGFSFAGGTRLTMGDQFRISRRVRQSC